MTTRSEQRNTFAAQDRKAPVRVETIVLQSLVSKEAGEVMRQLTARADSSTPSNFYTALIRAAAVPTSTSPRVYLFDVLRALSDSDESEHRSTESAGLTGWVIRRVYLQCEAQHPSLCEVFTASGVDMTTIDTDRKASGFQGMLARLRSIFG